MAGHGWVRPDGLRNGPSSVDGESMKEEDQWIFGDLCPECDGDASSATADVTEIRVPGSPFARKVPGPQVHLVCGECGHHWSRDLPVAEYHANVLRALVPDRDRG
jgi:hypothetical protein